jgi:hypothetical protein
VEVLKILFKVKIMLKVHNNIFDHYITIIGYSQLVIGCWLSITFEELPSRKGINR